MAYRFLWSNTQPMWDIWVSVSSHSLFPDIPFNDTKNAVQIAQGTSMSSFLSVEDLEKNVRNGEQFLHEGFARTYLADARAQCKAHEAFYARIRDIDFSTLTLNEMLPYWEELAVQFAKTVGYFRGSQEEASRKLLETITSVVPESDAPTLLVPSRLDVINEETQAWNIMMQGGFTREKAQEHLVRYPWLHQNTPTVDETLNALALRATDTNEAVDIEEEKRVLKEQQERILAEYPDIRTHVDIFQELAVLRTEVKGVWASSEYYGMPLLRAAAEQAGEEPATLMSLYLHEDICRLFQTGVRLTEEDIKNRRLGVIQILRDGVVEAPVCGSDANRLARDLLPDWFTEEEVRELRGMVARPGTVTGRARILVSNDPAVAKDFRETFTGGVLVTSMTQPNVVDIVRKADAIVTDEGSMLSHAAIISREFKIPCIIGTKTATRVIKNGDLVEVDGSTGIVRILERAG